MPGWWRFAFWLGAKFAENLSQSPKPGYLHAADAVLLAAADMVARRTAELMDEH